VADRRRTNEERSRTTRTRLVAAARWLFEERGYAETSIDDLAAAAEVSKGALYHHFPTKAALFEAVIVDIQDELAAHVDRSARKEDDAWAGFVAGWLSALDVAPEAGIQRLMLDGPSVLGYERWQQIDDEHFMAPVSATIEHLHRTGVIDAEPSSELTRVLLTISNALLTLIAQQDDPAAARHRIVPIWARLLGSLRSTESLRLDRSPRPSGRSG
jgi:AcrR family transcriptional regulator